MNRLSRPSSLKAKGNTDEKVNYIINYLNQLVKELERILSGVKSNKTAEEAVYVKNVNYSNGKLIITYSNGSIQTFIVT